jgi:hypothetical protein
VPLSEEELRLLEQMERALVAEDPKLASTMRGTTLRRHARRRAFIAGGVFVAGVVVLMTGAIMSQTLVGIAGFVIMLGSAYVALTSWRGQSTVDEEQAAGLHEPFTLIEGGRSKKRGGRDRSRQHHSMMERFEERWRRRRDQQNGF